MIQCDWCGTWRQPEMGDEPTQCENACPGYPPDAHRWNSQNEQLRRMNVGTVDGSYDPQQSHERLAERLHEGAVRRAAGLNGPHG